MDDLSSINWILLLRTPLFYAREVKTAKKYFLILKTIYLIAYS